MVKDDVYGVREYNYVFFDNIYREFEEMLTIGDGCWENRVWVKRRVE